MPEQGSITRWIGDLRAGRAEAADALWRPYYERLVGLARRKLGDVPKRVADEEDVVVSAFQSFCAGAAAGRFPKLSDRDDLWQVLVMITARKASNQRKHQLRQKRGGGLVRGDSLFLRDLSDDEGRGLEQVMGDEPTPEFAAEVAEECRRLLDLLDDETLRTVAVAKMEGWSNDEIAERLQVKTRTIERKLNVIRSLWGGEGAA